MRHRRSIRSRWPFPRSFGLIWAGQFVSIVGSGIAGFGLSVWVYIETGSAAQFAAVMAFATLPMVLLWPVAGVAADRWGRRNAMLLSDAGAGAVSAAVLILLALGSLEVWHVYFAAALYSSFAAFQWPAYSAAIPDLVAEEHLGRANGLVELSIAGGRVLGPFFGGALLATVGLPAIMWIDLGTFLFALVTLLLVRIPMRHQVLDDGLSRIKEALRGWTHIRQRGALLALVIFFMLTNFTSAIPHLLLTPLILSFASEIELGTVMSTLGIGMVTAGFLMTAWGGARNLIVIIIAAVLIQGAAFIVYGITTSILLITAAAFAYGLCLTVIRASNQTLWQRKIPSELLGRVTAFRAAATGIPYPVAYVTAGILVDSFFEPAVLSGGWISDVAATVVGAGPGRGTALLMVVSGVLTVVFCAAAFLYPRLRRLDVELPDQHYLPAPAAEA